MAGADGVLAGGHSGAVDIVSLQRRCARTWPGLEQARLGEWELRAAGGFTGRANSALPLGDPGMPLPDAVDRVVAWYAERGLRPRFQLPARLPAAQDRRPGSSDGEVVPGVAELCDARGWISEPWTAVMLADPTAADAMAADAIAAETDVWSGNGLPDPELRWSPKPDSDWMSRYHRAGRVPPDAARRVVAAAPAHYLSLRTHGELIGIGRLALAGDLAVLSAIEVVPRGRRRGLGSLITRALVARGVQCGAALTCLQVLADNAAAIGLYRRLGFWTDHHYRYRSPVPENQLISTATAARAVPRSLSAQFGPDVPDGPRSAAGNFGEPMRSFRPAAGRLPWFPFLSGGPW